MSQDHSNSSDDGSPLHDLTIVDFSRVLAGPFATALLADLGARVIKIEPPEGDDYRHIGPFVAEESALFAFANRGKQSIALDLKKPADLDIALKLADRADAVVENFRPGVADKLGIGASTLMQRNRRLVYASISGFGQSGPLASRPAYDIIVQAMTGLMSITGDPNGPPTLIGEAIGDLTAGLFASWGILAALHQRQRTGRGARIDLAMFDALLSMMPTATCRYLSTGSIPMRVGNRHPLSTPFGVFRAGDSFVAVAVLNNRLFEEFCKVIEQPALSANPLFASDELRTKSEAVLRERFEKWSTARSAQEVIAALSAAGVPCAPIENVAQAVDSEQAKHRSLFRTSNNMSGIRLPEQPVNFSTMPRGRAATWSKLNEHGDDLRAEVAAAYRAES